MKRQTLQIGSALLATTALSSLAVAGTVQTGSSTTGTGTVAITPVSLASSVFGSTGATAVGLGPIAFNLDFENTLTTSIDVDLSATGAKFSASAGPVGLATYAMSTGSLALSLQVATGGTCTVQVLTERILVDNCVGTTTSVIDVIQLSGIVFNQANGLSTAGNSIALSGIVTGNTGNQTFELISAANVVTSANPVTVTAAAGNSGSFTINNTATPPFSSLTIPTSNTESASTRAIIGTVNVTSAGTVGTDLATPIAAANLSGGMVFNITHGVLTDTAAVTDLHLSASGAAGNQSVSGSALGTNTASFSVAAANILGSFEVEVNFNGTTAISAWPAGTVAVAFTAGGQSASAPAGLTNGALSAFSRGGFQAQINTAQSTAVGDFLSFVRITNNGSVAGTTSIQVANDATGSVYGTFTTATLAPNSTVQIGMSQIEAGVPIATPAGQYMLNVSGSISGYAQHVMLNTQSNTFVDLSGFRIGSATTGFP